MHRLVLPERQLCTGGIRTCRAGSHGRQARRCSRQHPPRGRSRRPRGRAPMGTSPRCRTRPECYASVWQMPVAMISTSTSLALGPSRSSSTISSGCLGAKATAAGLHRHLRSCISSRLGSICRVTGQLDHLIRFRLAHTRTTTATNPGPLPHYINERSKVHQEDGS